MKKLYEIFTANKNKNQQNVAGMFDHNKYVKVFT